MTIAEFLALPEAAGRKRTLIGGRLFDNPARPQNRQQRGAIARLLDVLTSDEWDLRTDFLVHHEPENLFPVEVAALRSPDEPPSLVVLVPRPAETYGEQYGKVEACLASGVEQVWVLQFYGNEVQVHQSGERRTSIRGNDPLPTPSGRRPLTPKDIYEGVPEPESFLPEGMEELWLDILREKHECYGHHHTAAVEVTVDDRTVTLVLPDHLAETEILTVAVRDDLLFAIGRESEPYDRDGYLGVVLVARRHGPDRYLVHVWHALYPYILMLSSTWDFPPDRTTRRSRKIDYFRIGRGPKSRVSVS